MKYLPVYNRYQLAEMLGGSPSTDALLLQLSWRQRDFNFVFFFFQFFMPLQLKTTAENYRFARCDCGKLVKRTLWFLLRFATH